MNNRQIQKTLIALIIALFCGSTAWAQGIVVKSNLLCDMSGTFNLGAECSLSERASLSLTANYNPWEFSDDAKRKYLLFQPEYRRWVRGVYDGYFIGAQLNYGVFNIGGKLPWWVESCDLFENNRYQGDLFGAGVTNGYQWILSPRLNFEISASLGYAYVYYDKYEVEWGTPMIETGNYNYWGVTQVGITLVYYIK